MSERMSRGHEKDAGGGSTPALPEATRPPATPAELARDATTEFARDSDELRRAIEAVRAARAANNVDRWTEARQRLDGALQATGRASERARARTADADPQTAELLATMERQVVELQAAATTLIDAPTGFAKISREAELESVLGAPLEGGAAIGYQRKEASLRAEFDQLSTEDCRILAQRFRRSRTNDTVATLFNRMTGERRNRLLGYLDGARRREALHQERRLRAERSATTSGQDNAALPDSVRGDLESATGTSLSEVRVHAGAMGADVAANHQARAVADGSDIYMGSGQFDPASGSGRELIAHEVAHVVQAKQSPTGPQLKSQSETASVNAAEVEADTFGAAFRAHGAAASFTPTATSRGPMRKALGHDAFDAHMDYALLLADRKGELVTAGAYAHHNMKDLRHELGQFLLTRALSPGDGVKFVDGRLPFLAQLSQSLDTADNAHDVQVLRTWVAPLDLYAIIDRNRALFEDGKPQPNDLHAGLNYADGMKGPLRWCSAVALGIGSVIEARLAESMPRMGARLAAKTAEHRASNREDSVQATELVPSSPLDWEVALAYCGRGGERATVVVPAGPIKVDPTTLGRNRDLKGLVWQGAVGGPWNAVKAPHTPDVTTEDIAATVAGSSMEAYRIQRVGDTFIFPEEMAALVPDAAKHRPLTTMPNDAVDQIALGKDGASAANAEAERELVRIKAIETKTGHVPPKTPAPTVDGLTKSWQQIHDQLDGLLTVCKPQGLGSPIAQAMVVHAQRRTDLGTLTGHDAEVRAQLFASQHALLTDINLQAGDLTTQLLASKATDPRHSSVHDALQKIVRAASLSHMPETGRAVLAEAAQARNDAVFETLEGTLADAEAKIEVTRQNGAVEQASSRSTLGDGYSTRADALRTRVAELRSQFLNGKPSADAVKDLYSEIDALRFEVKLAAHISTVRTVYQSLDQLEDSNWVIMSGGHQRLEDRRIATFELKSELQAIHTQWITLEKNAQQISAMLKGNAKGLNPDAMALQIAEPMIQRIRARLAALGGDAKVRDFLNDAYDTMQSAQHRAMILQIATMIGIAIAASVTGGVGEGAALALTGSQAGAALAGMVVESTYFTVVSARLSGEPVAQAMVSNFAGNLATIGALKGFDKLLGMTRIGKVLGAVADGEKVGKAAYLGAKGVELSGRMLVAAGVQFAQAEYENMLKNHGRTLTTDELVDVGVQGMGMMIGTAVIGRLAKTPLSHIKALGARGALVVQRHFAIEALAERVAKTGNGGDAIELLREERSTLEDQQEMWNELAKEKPADLEKRGLSPALVKEMGSGAKAHLAALDTLETGALPAQLGLEPLVPGRVFIGDAKTVTGVISGYVERGYTIENVPREDGQTQYRVTNPREPAPIEIIARAEEPGAKPSEPSKPADPHRVMLAGTDEELIRAAPLVKHESGSLDVILHGTVDDFIVNTEHGEVSIDHRALATYIRKSGAKYTRVRLLSCKTGAHNKGAAQHLANKLGVPVVAPSDKLWIHEGGRLTIGPHEERDTGTWVEYQPAKSESRYQKAAEPPEPTVRERAAARAREGDPDAAQTSSAGASRSPKSQATALGHDDEHEVGLAASERTRPKVNEKSDIEDVLDGASDFAHRAARSVTLEQAQAVHDVELRSLQSDLQVESGLRVLDPVFGATSSQALKAAHKVGKGQGVDLLVRQRDRSMEAMLDVMRDPELSIDQRKAALLRQLDTYEEAVKSTSAVKADAFGFSEARVQITALHEDVFANMLSVDEAGNLSQQGKAVGTLPQLMKIVKSVNALYHEQAVSKELVISVSQPTHATVQREVKLLSRTRNSSSPSAHEAPVDGHAANGVVVDIGVGLGSFARDVAGEAGPLVQTEYGRKYADPAMIRRDLTWEHTAPRTDVDSVVVLGDALQTLPMMFEAKSVRRLFINNINAHYPEGGAEYHELALGLRRVMAEGGSVEVQWTDDLETTGAVTSSRGHVTGQALARAIEATETAAPRAVSIVESKPITNHQYSVEAPRPKSGEPSKTPPSNPIPAFRWLFTFGK